MHDLEQRERAQRHLLGGLEHDRRAGRDRRRELVRDLVERVVERRDRADQPHGHAQRVRAAIAAVSGDVAGERLAVVAQRLDRGEPEDVDRTVHLVPRVLQAEPGLASDQRREFLGASASSSATANEHLRALVPVQRALVRGAGGQHLPDPRRAGERRLTDQLAGVGRAHRECASESPSCQLVEEQVVEVAVAKVASARAPSRSAMRDDHRHHPLVQPPM